jgi:hypothetical protein
MMAKILAAVLLALTLNITETECPGITIVRNGLSAFAAGTPQIGPYTDPDAYLIGGIAYIYLRCGPDVLIPDDWQNTLNNLD